MAADSSVDLVAGKALFQQHCDICHYADSTAQKIGPGLKGIYAHDQTGKGKGKDETRLTRWIESGGKNMPGFKAALKPDQIRAVVEYLKTF